MMAPLVQRVLLVPPARTASTGLRARPVRKVLPARKGLAVRSARLERTEASCRVAQAGRRLDVPAGQWGAAGRAGPGSRLVGSFQVTLNTQTLNGTLARIASSAPLTIDVPTGVTVTAMINAEGEMAIGSSASAS